MHLLGLVLMTGWLVLLQQPQKTRAAPRAGWFDGIFTRRSNNPAFKCNKVNIGSGTTFDNVVVETRLHVFNNEDDDLYTGSDCETLPLDNCDPNVKVYIDTATPVDNWPADMQMTELIREWNHNDIHPDYENQHDVASKKHVYTACKFVPKFTLATIRVAVEDVDVGPHNDVINHFNCHWAPNNGAGVAQSASEAQWVTINCCTALERKMKSTVEHELKMDVRAYRDDKAAGTATGDGAGGRCPYGEGRFP